MLTFSLAWSSEEVQDRKKTVSLMDGGVTESPLDAIQKGILTSPNSRQGTPRSS
jgi:hypothetical protein